MDARKEAERIQYLDCPDCEGKLDLETNVYGDGVRHSISCEECGWLYEIDGRTPNWMDYLAGI